MEGAVDDIGSAVLISVSGMVADIQQSAVPNSNRVGVTLGPPVIGEMTGQLHLAVRGIGGRAVGEAYALLEESFSIQEMGRLTVVDGHSQRWQVTALAMPFDVTEQSAWAPGRNVVECSVSLRAPGGVWVGDTEEVTPVGGVAVVPNRGSVTVYPHIVWTGAGCRVETPAGVQVTLPTVSAPRYLSTDAGRGFVVTDGEGNVDSGTWAAMRGLPVWGEILPRGSAEWRVLAGQVHFEVTPMIVTPWR